MSVAGYLTVEDTAATAPLPPRQGHWLVPTRRELKLLRHSLPEDATAERLADRVADLQSATRTLTGILSALTERSTVRVLHSAAMGARLPIMAAERAGNSTADVLGEWVDECLSPKATDSASHLTWSEAFERLDEFSRLPANWDSYDADPISPRAIARAREFLFALRHAFASRALDQFMPVNIAPIADGGLQFEWETENRLLEIEFTADGRIASFLAEGTAPNRRSTGKTGLSTTEALDLVASVLELPIGSWVSW